CPRGRDAQAGRDRPRRRCKSRREWAAQPARAPRGWRPWARTARALLPPWRRAEWRSGLAASSHVIAVAADRVDDRDLLHREVGDDLGAVGVDDEHLLDAHAELVRLPVLRLEREHHPRLDLDGMVERPDARDDGRIVLREPQAVAPKVGS